MLILITIIVVILVFVFLIYLYLKEARKKPPEEPAVTVKEVEEDVSKEKQYKKDIEKLKRSLPYLNKKEASSRFIKIVRSFFKDLLALNYEFTFEELAKELKEKGRNKGLIEFAEKISEYKYKKGDIYKKQLKKLCKEFIAILDYESIPQVEKIEKKGFFDKLRNPSIPHIRKPPVNNKQKDSQNS
ncbi:MAG: hypothetical protein JSW73_01245 [Candidatus Woesearchaeota archaeon]|nr:MAG: hypothetical protein JSW73_01245 [Candidatus Woesearchaeota archaeon]